MNMPRSACFSWGRQMRRCFAVTVVALALGLAAAEQAQAQSSEQSFAQQMWDRLQATYDVIGAHDHSLQNYVIGHLGEGDRDSWTFPFSPNTDYIISGTCDSDCSDFGYMVKDGKGRVIAKLAWMDETLLQFRTGSHDRYTVEVEMYGCSSDPCYFGLGVFPKK